MVLPDTIDLQIFDRMALLAEAELGQERATRLVVRQAGGLDAMKSEALESVGQERVHRLAHHALMGEGRPHPITEAAGLRHAAADIAQIDSTHQRLTGGGEDEETIAL